MPQKISIEHNATTETVAELFASMLSSDDSSFPLWVAQVTQFASRNACTCELITDPEQKNRMAQEDLIGEGRAPSFFYLPPTDNGDRPVLTIINE